MHIPVVREVLGGGAADAAVGAGDGVDLPGQVVRLQVVGVALGRLQPARLREAAAAK